MNASHNLKSHARSSSGDLEKHSVPQSRNPRRSFKTKKEVSLFEANNQELYLLPFLVGENAPNVQSGLYI